MYNPLEALIIKYYNQRKDDICVMCENYVSQKRELYPLVNSCAPKVYKIKLRDDALIL